MHFCTQSLVFFILYSGFDGYLSSWQPVVPLWNLVIDRSSTSSAACLSQLVGWSTTFACALVQLLSTFWLRASQCALIWKVSSCDYQVTISSSHSYYTIHWNSLQAVCYYSELRNRLYFSYCTAVLMATWAVWFHCETWWPTGAQFLQLCVGGGRLVSCALVLLLPIFSDWGLASVH